MNKKIILPLIIVLFALPLVLAIDFNQELDPEDQEAFDEILEPVMAIYNFIKYGATAVAGCMLLFSGVNFMTAGSDIKKRDTAKHIATYVIVGLVVIWAAPLVVNFLVG